MRLFLAPLGLLMIAAGCHSSDYVEVKGFDGKPFKILDMSAEVKRRRKHFDQAERIGPVSLLQLIATPEKFHGKRVVVSGYAILEFEVQGIFPSRDLAEVGCKNGVWLDYDFGSLPNNPERTDFVPMLIEGVFDAEGGGHMGLWAGELCCISRLERLPNKTEPNQRPERNDPSCHAGCCAPVAPAGAVAHP